jgi:phage protein D
MPFGLGSLEGETFQSLAEKHGGFKVPSYSVSIADVKIDITKYPIMDLNVKMSMGLDMSSCEFTVAAFFDQKSGVFDPDIYTELKPGQTVDVSVGYESPVGVFKGFINTLSFQFSGSGVKVSVQCLDSRAALVNSYEWINYPNENASSVISSVLASRCGDIATIGKVEFLFDSEVIPNINGQEVDDYQFISGLATDTYHSFCMVYDTITFCDNLVDSTSDPSVKLKWGESLMEFSSEIDLSKQVGKVTVYGNDPKYSEQISSSSSTISGDGDSGKDLSDIVSNKSKKIFTTLVLDADQATTLAKRGMQASASKLVHCRGTTIGLPEIICGIVIGIDGMGQGVDGNYFLTNVTHRINGQGYITSFEGCSSTVASSSASML